MEVVAIIEDSPSQRGGLEKNDIIIGINGRKLESRNQTAFERYERNPSPVALSVRRGERVKLLTVTPVDEEPEAEPSPDSPPSDT